MLHGFIIVQKQYTKTYWITYFKRVNYMVYEVYLDKAILTNQTKTHLSPELLSAPWREMPRLFHTHNPTPLGGLAQRGACACVMTEWWVTADRGISQSRSLIPLGLDWKPPLYLHLHVSNLVIFSFAIFMVKNKTKQNLLYVST